MRTATLLLLVLEGCAMGYRDMRASSTQAEANAFDECRSFIVARACPTSETGIRRETHQGVCIAGVAGQYGKLPTLAARRSFLGEAGCPATIVDQALPPSAK